MKLISEKITFEIAFAQPRKRIAVGNIFDELSRELRGSVIVFADSSTDEELEHLYYKDWIVFSKPLVYCDNINMVISDEEKYSIFVDISDTLKKYEDIIYDICVTFPDGREMLVGLNSPTVNK